MGHFFAQEVLGIEKPKIGLMSVGEEEGKGTDIVKESFRLLKESGLKFVGNVEGRDVYGGDVDVIVTDGFTGNVILKVSESLAHLVEEALKQEITRSLQASMGFLLSKDAFRSFKKRLDYSEYGGAPLLGVNGACFIGHGRSNAQGRAQRHPGRARLRPARHSGEDPRAGAHVRAAAALPVTSRLPSSRRDHVSRHDRRHRPGRSRRGS